MSAENQLVEVPAKETALQVYSAANGLDPFLAKIREEIDGFVPDVTTRKGREAIASIAYKVARSKTALDNVGKELVAELKEVPKKIDAERKRMRDLLDGWQEEVRRPLTEWEEAEKARVAEHERRISELRCVDVEGRSAAEIASAISLIEEYEIDGSWEEFEAEAHRVKSASLSTLREALAKRQQYEAEQAELERLRAEAAAREQKEREERIAREAAEAERLAAERRAQEERDAATRREAEAKAAAERRELELKLQAQQAEREKLEANSAPNRQSVMRNDVLKKPQRKSVSARPTSGPASNARLLHAKPTRRTRKPSTTKRWRRSSLVAWMSHPRDGRSH